MERWSQEPQCVRMHIGLGWNKACRGWTRAIKELNHATAPYDGHVEAGRDVSSTGNIKSHVPLPQFTLVSAEVTWPSVHVP